MLGLEEIEASRDQREKDRILREATLFALLMERFETAQAEDAHRKATKRKNVTGGWSLRQCNDRSKQLAAQVGQIEILERMAALGISLEAMKATGVNFESNREKESGSPGINLVSATFVNADFQNSNLRFGNFSGSDLQFSKFGQSCLESARFVGADLRMADFVKSDLSNADLSKADLSGADLAMTDLSSANFSAAILENTDLTGAYLQSITGLTQAQLDRACANSAKKEPRLPESLTWKMRECP